MEEIKRERGMVLLPIIAIIIVIIGLYCTSRVALYEDSKLIVYSGQEKRVIEVIKLEIHRSHISFKTRWRLDMQTIGWKDIDSLRVINNKNPLQHITYYPHAEKR